MSSQARTTIVDGLLFDGVSPLRAEATIVVEGENIMSITGPSAAEPGPADADSLVRWPRTFTGLGTCGALRVMIIMVWPSGRLPGLGVQQWPGRWPGRGQAVRSGALGGRRRRVPWRLARVLVSDLRSREGRQAAGEPVRGT